MDRAQHDKFEISHVVLLICTKSHRDNQIRKLKFVKPDAIHAIKRNCDIDDIFELLLYFYNLAGF